MTGSPDSSGWGSRLMFKTQHRILDGLFFILFVLLIEKTEFKLKRSSGMAVLIKKDQNSMVHVSSNFKGSLYN